MAVPYYGDFAEDDTINIPFNTFSSDDPSASITITDLADADIKVHKDGHVDQIVTDGATVVINFDGITGNHLVTIDTSVDAAYATGSEYQVRIEGTTVDGATINAWVGAFSIERAGGQIALLKLIQAAVITNATGADVAADIIAVKAVADAAATAAKLLKYIQLLARSDAAIETDNSTELTAINADGGSGAGNYSAQTDSVEAIKDHIGDGTNLTEAGGDGDHLTAINLPNQTMDITGSITGNLIGDVTGNVDGTVAGVTPEAAGVAPTAAEIRTEMDSNSTQLAAIVADTNELQTDDTPSALAAIDAKIDIIDTNVDSALADTNELQTDWADGGRLDLLLDGAASAGDPWLTALPGAYGAGTAGKIIGDNIDAPLSTIDTNVDSILADTNELQTDDYPTSIAAIKAETALIVADTNELQTDDTPAAIAGLDTKLDTIDNFLDTEIAAIVAAVITNAAGADVAADIIALKAVADAIPTTAMRGTDNANTTVPDAAGTAATLHGITDGKIDTLNNLSSANVTAACTSSLNTYDPPTKAELDSGLAGLNNISQAQVNAQVDAALNTAIPVSPTANSINERIKALDDKLPSKNYLAGTNNTDGDIEANEMTGGISANVTVLGGITLDDKVGRNFDYFFQNADADTTKRVDNVGVAGSSFDPDTQEVISGFTWTELMQLLSAKFVGKRTMSKDSNDREYIEYYDYNADGVVLTLRKDGNTVERTVG